LLSSLKKQEDDFEDFVDNSGVRVRNEVDGQLFKLLILGRTLFDQRKKLLQGLLLILESVGLESFDEGEFLRYICFGDHGGCFV
jgi:hypothetical protein